MFLFFFTINIAHISIASNEIIYTGVFSYMNNKKNIYIRKQILLHKLVYGFSNGFCIILFFHQQ